VSAHLPQLFEDIEAVLFDLDGTLIDSAPDLGGAANQMRTDRGLVELPLVEYRCLVGSGARGMLAVSFGLSPESVDYELFKEEFFSIYESRLTRLSQSFLGVAELVQRLEQSQIPWGVVTNKAKRFTVPLTKSMRLFDSARSIVSGDTASHAKPHPAPLLLAAREMGFRPEKCLYVGDDERDIIAGKAAGMRTVAAAYGYLGVDVDYRQWNADAAIQSPLELALLLNLPPYALN
jgi:N-acetyl-D-muramate 6-phosphate phosphatase